MGVFRATVDLSFPAGAGVGTNSWTLRTVSSSGTVSEITTLMGLVNGFYDYMKGLFPASYTWRWDGTVQQLGVPNPGYLGSAPAWSVSGTSADPNYGPAAAMACITWRTELATRSGRGRTFLGPLPDGANESNGSLAPAYLDVIVDAAQDLVTASEASGVVGALAVWSEKDQVARDFVAASVTDQFAVLRSRRS